MSPHKHIVFLVIITARKKRDEILELLSQNGAQLISTLYARGSASASSFALAFGLAAEEHKIMTTCLLSSAVADTLIETLDAKYGFEKPNSGIAFTVPVEGLSY